MHPELQEAVDFHDAIVAEAGKALVGYETEKALANVVLLSEIPTTYDKDEQRQVNAGNLLLRGVPGIGKTFFGVIIAAISDAKFARLQGRADLQPTEVVGFQMINPATGAFITEFGPLASAEVILLDEINRIPLKSQSAFLEGLQDRKITVGKTTYDLPTFSFTITTINPIELGQGTFPMSEAATDRFAIMVNIGYLPPAEERARHFDFKQVRLNSLMSKERIVQLRGVIGRKVSPRQARQVHPAAGRRHTSYNAETDGPTITVGDGRAARRSWRSPRATIAWGRLGRSGQCWCADGARCIRRTCRIWRSTCSRIASGWGLMRRATASPRSRSSKTSSRGPHPMSARRVAERSNNDFVDFAEISEIELRVLKRMKEYTLGDHGSVFHGTGVDFVGLRDWQAGDRLSSIDWPQSTLTNFNPMVIREYEQPGTAPIVVVADRSPSTRCGAGARRLPPVWRGRWRRSDCRRSFSGPVRRPHLRPRISTMAAIPPRVGGAT